MLFGEDRLRRARIKTMQRHPFYGYLLLQLRFREAENVETMAVDLEGNLYFNPKHTDKLYDAELMLSLCHEVSHLGLEHPARMGNRKLIVLIATPRGLRPVSLWNLATDYAVNAELRKALIDYKLPNGWLYDERFEGKSAEEIYDILERELAKAPKIVAECPYNCFECPFKPETPCEDKKIKAPKAGEGEITAHLWEKEARAGKVKASKKKWHKIVQEARIFGERHKGDIPAVILRELDELLQPKLDTRELIKKAIVEKIKSDYTWLKPSRRYYSPPHIYTPAMRNSEGIKIAIAFDTSGSMSKKEITQSISEVKAIFEEYEEVEAIIMDCDAKVYNLWQVESIEQLLDKVKSIKGGGGTDYRPIFKLIKEKELDIRLLVVFCDLMGDYPAHRPNYDVIWVATKRDVGGRWLENAQRIGEVIYLD